MQAILHHIEHLLPKNVYEESNGMVTTDASISTQAQSEIDQLWE